MAHHVKLVCLHHQVSSCGLDVERVLAVDSQFDFIDVSVAGFVNLTLTRPAELAAFRCGILDLDLVSFGLGEIIVLNILGLFGE